MLLAFGVPLPNFLLPGYRKYIKGLESLDNAVNVIIKSRLSDGSWLTANDIIAFLLRAQKESNGVYPSDKQIRDEVISLLFAGSETTAQTLTFLFYCLATHPEAFHRVSQEAKRVIGNKNAQEISFEDLKQLRYITACIKCAPFVLKLHLFSATSLSHCIFIHYCFFFTVRRYVCILWQSIHRELRPGMM